MAVQVSYSYKGLAVPAAYARLLHYQVVKDDGYATFTIGIHANQAARVAVPRVYLEPRDFVVRNTLAVLGPDGVTVVTPASTAYTDLFSDANLRLSGQSPEKSCYTYLKGQPGFQSGLDV